jgi:hypothetical protein
MMNFELKLFTYFTGIDENGIVYNLGGFFLMLPKDFKLSRVTVVRGYPRRVNHEPTLGATGSPQNDAEGTT